ncbi:hypothetical protein F5Y04DRAFT_243892 [Hypomontagnella monticulosa]|nr:hypothetical protein F5Y04DRAFT_243892 [Hypomontagnella monticulosa]
MDPVLSNILVPCVCDFERDTGPFSSFPERHGFDLAALEQGSLDIVTEADFGVHLQGWLCFSLIKEACRLCRVQFNPYDLVVNMQSNLLISYSKLEIYIWHWCGAGQVIPVSDLTETRAKFCELLYLANSVVNLRNTRSLHPISEYEEIISMSIMALVDYLAFNVDTIFDLSGVTMGRLEWARCQAMDRLLLNAGWCRGELPHLYADCSPVVLLYHSTLGRGRQDKDHSRCTDAACLANQVDGGTYVPSHADTCDHSQCEMIFSPVQDVCEVIKSGGIPIVRVLEGRNGLSVDLARFDLGDPDNMPSYVAISHVWSDGMGNPETNSLRLCQLNRIQKRVNALNPTSETNCFFWMDTLCVPLESGVRNIAISRMTKTYAHSTSVLVLDKWLEDSTANTDSRESLIRIARSNWNQRLWTFQEAKLARDCRFQLYSGPATLDQFSGEEFLGREKLTMVVDHLSSFNESDFLQNPNLMALLKAVLGDDISQDLVNRYANLPPQDDEDEEELRIIAVGMLERFNQQARIRKKWDPIIERFGDHYKEIPVGRLETRLAASKDPVFSYGQEVLGGIRGAYFRYTMDRDKDMTTTVTREFTGYSSPPYLVFSTVVRGLVGRQTSRAEDEPICVSSIIGLDVSDMLEISAGKQRTDEEVDRVCAARMCEFYLALKEIDSGALYWNVTRLKEPMFLWAPRTFMTGGADLLLGPRATITQEGLLTNISTIPIPNATLADLLSKRALLIETPYLEFFFRPDVTYYEQPPDFNPTQPRDFEMACEPLHRKAFLAETTGERDGRKVLRYVMHMEVIDRPRDDDYLHIKTVEHRSYDDFWLV